MAETEQKARNVSKRLIEELIDHLAWVRKILSDETAREAITSDLGLDATKLGKPPEESASITAYREAAARGDRISKETSLGVLADILAVYDTLFSIGEAAAD